MTAYAFWNNKGGVGKSFLCFAAASEYAHYYPDVDVYVIDLCPQANVSETFLGGFPDGPAALNKIINKKSRASVAGYLEARLNSPFRMINNVSPYVCRPCEFNKNIPDNLLLVCGDNFIELLAEAVRQTSLLSIPPNAWKQVQNWIRDLTVALREISGAREAVFTIDCSPSFSMPTQLALAASENLIIPFTADDSSRRGIENLVALLYGIGGASYARISFAKHAKEEGLFIPKLHTFVSNRLTQYRSKPDQASITVINTIKKTIDALHKKHRNLFANPKQMPSENFVEIPDYGTACVFASMTGTPFHKIKAGTNTLVSKRIQISPGPLNKYRKALEEFVSCL